MPEIAADLRVHTSRIPAPRRLLKAMRRLVVRASRIRITRCSSDVERSWVGDVFDELTGLIQRGEIELPAHVDPRDWRRARKTPAAADAEPLQEAQFFIGWETLETARRCAVCRKLGTPRSGLQMFVRIDNEMAWCCRACAAPRAPNLAQQLHQMLWGERA